MISFVYKYFLMNFNFLKFKDIVKLFHKYQSNLKNYFLNFSFFKEFL
jgi:hypothetical protein